MRLSQFFLYHLVFVCTAMGAVFWPSVRIMAYVSGCIIRCQEITAAGLMLGVAFGAIAGYVIYALAFRLILGHWPHMAMLALGTLQAVIGVAVISIIAAQTALDGWLALALSVGLILIPGCRWVFVNCGVTPHSVSGDAA